MSQKTFDDLRNTYNTFTYNGWRLDKSDGFINVEFSFSIEGLCEFHPSTRIKTDNLDIVNDFDSVTAEKIIFNLGMVELISYWKCACPENIEIKCGHLSDDDIAWWKKLYFGGLSEFFYINGITADENSFMKITCTGKDKRISQACKYNTTAINLIPVGGGKDSCVTASLVKSFGKKNMFFTVNDQKARTDTVVSAGYGEQSIVRTYRTIDRQLIDLNSKGFLNGHTPFSAIVAFLSLYCAYLIGGEYIILSNESSANESNIEGTNVNHQYSKSYEFESDFMAYVERNIISGISYFSILRPFSELQIASMFSNLPEYHYSFRSCNRGSKNNIWCAKCAKCLFVFTILAAFMPYDKIIDIFGSDMLNDLDMQNDFDGLAGLTPLKPFECVGTKEEFCYALGIISKRCADEGREPPLLVKHFADVTGKKMQIDNNLLKEYNPLNNVPDEFLFAVKEMYDYVAGDN